jgi:hypothetical protein
LTLCFAPAIVKNMLAKKHLGILIFLSACASERGPATDAGESEAGASSPEAGNVPVRGPARSDSGTDAVALPALDGGASLDAGRTEASGEWPPLDADLADAGRDQEADWGVDAGREALAEAGREAERETGPEVGPEVGKESGPEVGKEVGRESGPEAGKEVGREAGRESGPETRPCPSYCFEGCNVGCGADGQCVACATCSCDATTGTCHC